MIEVTNWQAKQHYHKKEGPPLWIKLYRDWISNEHVKLDMDDHLRYVMVGLWCLAARHTNEIPERLEYLSGELGTVVTQDDLDRLEAFGFIALDHGSRPMALDTDSRPTALDSEEKRREEKKREEGGADAPTVAAVGVFLERVGVGWDLKRPIDEWCAEIQTTDKYAGADFPYEIQKAADWHAGKKKRPKPSMALRNWLERAARDARARAKSSRPSTGQKYERLRAS